MWPGRSKADALYEEMDARNPQNSGLALRPTYSLADGGSGVGAMIDLETTFLEDEETCADFCAECAAVTVEYGIRECPAAWDIADNACARRRMWLEIRGVLRDAAREIEDTLRACAA